MSEKESLSNSTQIAGIWNELIKSVIGNALYDIAKFAGAAAFNVKVDTSNLVELMSYGARDSLEKLFKLAGEYVDLTIQAERSNDQKSANIYRKQLSNVYEQMSSTLTQDAYNIEKKDSRFGDYARRLSGVFLHVSRKVTEENSVLPKVNINDLRRSQGLEQNSLVANSNLNEALSMLDKIKQDSSSSIAHSNLSTNPDIAAGLEILDQIKKDQQSDKEIALSNITEKESVAPSKSKDDGIGGR